MPPAAPHRTWTLRELDPGVVDRLARKNAVPKVVASVLAGRGHTEPEAVATHLEASPMGLHDPFLLPDMEAATERLERAVRDGERILIHGDYDVDGVTGTALLMRLLAELGGRARWHIPNRLTDGYSFGAHSVARALETESTVGISVDNGTSATGTIAELASHGVDTVVTDHHEPPAGPLPEAVAIVNPKLEGSRYPWRELCGGAVAFKLAWGLAQRTSGGRRVSEALKRFLEDATAYVAIATVGDVVPLVDENRIFARFGLKALESTRSPGLRALLSVCGLAGRQLCAQDVGFQIGPRINAAGRLGSAQRAVELLLAATDERARELARELDALNLERKRIEREVWAEAREAARRLAESDEHPVLVVAGQGWHQGVVGIVAARLSEEFGRPSLVIGLDGDEGRGSARSVPGFDVLDALRGGAEHFARFGGHAQAAGCEIAAADVDRARADICERAAAMLGGDGHPPVELVIDDVVPLPQMTRDLMRHLERLEPFGADNEEPVLLSSDVRLARAPYAVGSDKSHLVMHVRHGATELKALGFGMAGRMDELELGAPLHVVYTPRWNTFRGETRLELYLADFRVGAAPPLR